MNKIVAIKSPERIGSTELCKYCATVSQVEDLTELDLKSLADHNGAQLGRTLWALLTKRFCIELTKVSRLLLAMISNGRR